MRRRWIYAAAAAMVLLLGLDTATYVGGESAEKRVRRYFDVPGALDTVALRTAVLRRIPIGSSESRLTELVESRRIGADGSSIYYPATGGRTALIRVDEKPAPLQLVTESYMISFKFDGARQVREVRVRRAFTGP